MAKKLTNVVGIDIGSETVKVAEIKVQGGAPILINLGMAPTPEGAVDQYGVVNSEAVAAAIKEALKAGSVSSKDAVVSVTGQGSVLVRTLEVPRMSDAELKDHMEFEIHRNVPFAESTVISDFKVLSDEDPNSPNIEVVMAISPQSAIDNIISCVKKAGKKLGAIDVEPLGIARVVESNYAGDLANQTVCVVDMGSQSTSINVYKNGKLLMPRLVPLGGGHFTEQIAQKLSLPKDEAENLKREFAIPESALVAAAPPVFADEFSTYNPFMEPTAETPTLAPEQAPFNPFADSPEIKPEVAAHEATAEVAHEVTEATVPPAVEPSTTVPPVSNAPVAQENPEQMRVYNAYADVLAEFSAEIRRSIDYFRTKGGEVNGIFLTGGGSELDGLARYISHSLGIACDTLDPVRNVNVDLKKLSPEFLEANKRKFALAIGNGLHIAFA